MRYYAVIDTNVVVSALLKRNSVPDTVVSLALGGVIVPLVNDEILSEYGDVLSRPKFGFDDETLQAFLAAFAAVAINLTAIDTLPWDMPDGKDRVFYEVVMEQRKTEEAYLVTGNLAHFPAKPFVVSPREMLEIIAGDETI